MRGRVRLVEEEVLSGDVGASWIGWSVPVGGRWSVVRGWLL